MTHKEIVKKSSKWIKRHVENAIIPNCPIVAEELITSAEETPDVLGFNYFCSVLIEVKISRSDFLADKKKLFRNNPAKGMGEYRLYCCPTDLIKIEELPENWGLLYCNEKGRITMKKAPKYQEANVRIERNVLMSIIRRGK